MWRHSGSRKTHSLSLWDFASACRSLQLKVVIIQYLYCYRNSSITHKKAKTSVKKNVLTSPSSIAIPSCSPWWSSMPSRVSSPSSSESSSHSHSSSSHLHLINTTPHEFAKILHLLQDVLQRRSKFKIESGCAFGALERVRPAHFKECGGRNCFNY